MEPTRAEILAAIEGRTLNGVFLATTAEHPAGLALSERVDGTMHRKTFADYRRLASQVAAGLRTLGIDHGDRVALMMSNRPEHVICDVGSMLAGGTPVSVYNTFAPEQTQYVAHDAAVKVAIVEAEYLDKWRAIRADLPALTTIVTVDADADGDGELDYAGLLAAGAAALDAQPDLVDASSATVTPDDVATLIYTSGTTGPPKGVQLTHRNILYLLETVLHMVELPDRMKGISYLPLAHIAERMLTHYAAMRTVAHIEYIRDPKQLLGTLTTHRPDVVLAVPRVWEKMQAGILGALAAEDERKRKIVLSAIDAGREVVRHRMAGTSVPLPLRLKHAVLDKLALSKLRVKLGVDHVKIALSGAAPIAPELLVWFAALGIDILEVYGMTESTAVISSNRPGRIKIGTVGEAVPGTDLRIAEDGEILSRGPHITPGYLNRAEATAEAIDADGWLHTGDLGKLEDGYLSIIGRKKELIITAAGKNLSPNNIEETIKAQSEIIATLCAIGDNRKFISALVVLDGDILPLWCHNNGIEFSDYAAAAQHPQVLAEIERAIKAGNEHLARVEQIKQWTVLTTDWAPGGDEMTPSMKLKRSVIHSKYADMIDSMYA